MNKNTWGPPSYKNDLKLYIAFESSIKMNRNHTMIYFSVTLYVCNLMRPFLLIYTEHFHLRQPSEESFGAPWGGGSRDPLWKALS